MSRTLIAYLVLMLCAAACGGMDVTAGTLSPLSSSPTDRSLGVPSSPRAVPHRAWYEQHRDAILEEAAAIRSFVAQLSAVTDSYVLAMICTKGVELDEDKYRAAYEAADVHPDWVHAVDLTRWMIASCHGDARRSVAEVLPELDDALARVEVWLAGMVDAQPGGTPSSGGPGAAGTPVTTAP